MVGFLSQQEKPKSFQLWMWKQAHSRQEEEDVNVNSQTASAAKDRVCRWDWLCKVKLYHPPTALAACVTQTFTCLFRVHATALVASPEKRGRPVPPNAVALSYCFTLANWVGPSFRKLCTPPGHSWLWGAGSSVSHCQRYRASSDQGNCWTLWEQVQVEELLSAVAVTASSWMLGKGFEEWVQNSTRQPFVCHSGRLSIMLRQELA